MAWVEGRPWILEDHLQLPLVGPSRPRGTRIQPGTGQGYRARIWGDQTRDDAGQS